MSRRPKLALAIGLAVATPAGAASTNPAQKDVCADGRLDRERLAIFVLDTQGVTRQLEAWAEAHRDGRYATARQQVAGEEGICDASGLCTPEMARKVSAAQDTIADVLRDDRTFDNPRAISEPAAFLTDGTVSVACRTLGGAPVEMAGVGTKPRKLDLPIRVRGTPASLIFLRGGGDFKTADKATLSFSDDGITDKRSTKLVGVLGYPISLRSVVAPGQYAFAELIPYVGINKNTSRVTGKDRTVTTDNWRLGALLTYRATQTFNAGTPRYSVLYHVLGARPEYLFNDKDGSQVASVNLTYMPVINSIPGLGIGLNAYRPLDRARTDFISVRPIIDLRLNGGTFTRRGDRPAQDARDFVRFGSQFGLALSHDDPNLPIDLAVTETYLLGLAGEPGELSQFKSVLSVAFDPDRYFGVDISYVRGRREDLADRERLWSIGFTLKY